MKVPISATIEKDIADWIDKEMQNKEKYRNKSHLIEIALNQLKKEARR